MLARVVRRRRWEVSLGTLAGSDRSYDIDFWQRAGVAARFEAAWDLVLEAHVSRGGDPSELRFQRSVVELERLPR
jgi:hypothetical protein